MAFLYHNLIAEDKERGIIIRDGGRRPEDDNSTPAIYISEEYKLSFKYYLKTKQKIKKFPAGDFSISIPVSCVIPHELIVNELEVSVRAAKGRAPSDEEIAKVLSDIQEGVLLLATLGSRYHEDVPNLKVTIEPGLMSWVTDKFGTRPAYHFDKIAAALDRNAVEVT